jgi:hypothetical protein
VSEGSRIRESVGALPNKALQLTANSTFQLRFGSVLAFNVGGSVTFGGAVGRS